MLDMTPKLVYIAHPLGNGWARRTVNRLLASLWVCWAAEFGGVLPVATWIILASRWSEKRRELGLSIDWHMVRQCDELWLVGGKISPGMAHEMDAACTAGLRVRNYVHLGRLPPDGLSRWWRFAGRILAWLFP